MRKEFVKILKALEVEGSFAENLRRRALSRCETQDQATELLRKLDHEEREDNCRDNVALYAIFRSCAYDVLGNKEASFAEATNALKGFRNCGNDFNEAIARWYIGLLYKDYKEYHLALPELDQAEQLLNRCIKFYELDSDYGKKAQCEEFSLKIKLMKRNLETKKVLTSSAAPSSPSPSPLWNVARLVYGVYDIAHASYVGKFVFEDELVSKVEIEEVLIDGKVYQLFSCRGGREIHITSTGDYRWLKASGNSMDQANPIPINSDDYILADLALTPKIGDIIVARFRTPPTPEEHAGVVKRYVRAGLKSESSQTIPILPLADMDLRGVVIAIAKLVQ